MIHIFQNTKFYIHLLLLAIVINIVSLAFYEAAQAQADPVVIQVEDAIVEPNQSVVLPVTIASGNQSVGAITLALNYDGTNLTPTSCQTIDLGGVCNLAIAGAIYISGADPQGVTGDFTLANITFDAIGPLGTITDVPIVEVSSLTDETASAITDFVIEDGQVIIDIATNLVLEKSASTVQTELGQLITYTVAISNISSTDATGVVMTDTLPSGVTYLSASPGCSESSGVVTCIVGNLGANGSTSIQIVTQVDTSQATQVAVSLLPACPDGTEGTDSSTDPDDYLRNVAIVESNELDSDYANNTDHSCVEVLSPPIEQVELVKTLNTLAPVRPGTPISFTIRITNTGETVIATLPLTDVYNSAYLGFVNAIPTAEDNIDDGVINWSNLTTTLGDLNPGDSVAVVVNFMAWLDTTALPDSATINRATIWDEVDEEPVQIFAPTSVDFIMREVTYENEKVIIQWETADETEVVGFHLYREMVDDDGPEGKGELIKLTPEMLIAEKSGSSSGASYTYEDTSTQASVDYRYFVGILDIKGFETQEPLGDVSTRRTVDEWFIFLPLTMK